MGRARRLDGGTGNTGLAIEYVRTRKVLRLLAWLGDAAIDPVEIPVEQLRSLGVTPRDLGAPQHFLLFAGSHNQPAGGLRDLVGTFDSDESAWAAFRELRQAHPSTQGWAELATIDELGHVTQMAWFGLHQAADPSEKKPAAGEGVGRRARPSPLHRPVPKSVAPAYLRAVTGRP